MKPKLIVLEGPDGSGKETQSKLLKKNLENRGYKVNLLSFPRYESNASFFEKNYLNGLYGNQATEIDPYETSVLFAVDRYDYFKNNPEDADFIICDRYTTSNMIHQSSKLKEKSERDSYINWLKDLEYKKMNIPIPDEVIFLDMDPNISKDLISKRNNKSDIHEANQKYLQKTYEIAQEVAQDENWKIIKCQKNNKLKSIDQIGDEVLEIVTSHFGI